MLTTFSRGLWYLLNDLVNVCSLSNHWDYRNWRLVGLMTDSVGVYVCWSHEADRPGMGAVKLLLRSGVDGGVW